MSAPTLREPRHESEWQPTMAFLDAQRDFLPHPASWVNSLLAHVVILGAILVLNFTKQDIKTRTEQISREAIKFINVPWPGGGGGDQSPTPASRGVLPPFSRTQLAPPTVRILIPNPQIPVQATLQVPPEFRLPDMVPNAALGDPNGVDGPESGGPGKRGGIGDGDGGGVGPGKGPGFGPDGEIFDPGRGGVTAPVPTFKPEPPYSEEARKAKHEGTVTLMIVVGPQGKVVDARVIRPLGMGLDEKALETVRTWEFQPGTRGGAPVAVRVLVEVSFRLF